MRSGFGLARAAAMLAAILPGMLFAAAASAASAATTTHSARGSLRLVQSIALPGVEGRLDHMALDPARMRLCIAALGNHSVEVVDLIAGRRTLSIGGFQEPQGLAFLPRQDRLFISDGGTGQCTVLACATFARADSFELGEDADNVRFDAERGLVWVGYGSGGLAAVDAASLAVRSKSLLPVHPEAFALEPGGRRIFVNLPGASAVGVIHAESAKLTGSWPLPGGSGNFPMALSHGRMLLGCRNPSRLRVLDSATGTELASLSLHADADDIMPDPAGRLVYVSCGGGYLDVFRWEDGGVLAPESQLPTAPGARTCLMDPQHRRLYLAVPHRGAQPAEIRVYEVIR